MHAIVECGVVANILSNAETKDVSQNNEFAGFSSDTEIPNWISMSMSSIAALYESLAFATLSASFGSNPNKPSGNNSDLNGFGASFGLIPGILMFLAFEAVPQLGAKCA